MVANSKTMTWHEIKNKYPHCRVGLIDVNYGANDATIESAVVYCTDRETPYETMLEMYLAGKILLRYTTLDEDEMEGVNADN